MESDPNQIISANNEVEQIKFQDESQIDPAKYPMFHKKMQELAKPIKDRTVKFKPAETV